MYDREDLYTPSEAGRELGVSHARVFQYMNENRFTIVECNTDPGRRYLLKSEVHNFIDPKQWAAIRKTATKELNQTIRNMRHETPRDVEAMVGAMVLGIIGTTTLAIIGKSHKVRG